MMGMGNTIDNRVTHHHIRRSHIDFGAQYLFAITELTGLHAGEQVEIFLHTAVAVRAFLARLRQRAAIFLNLFCRQIIDIGQTFFNEFYGIIIELVKVV